MDGLWRWADWIADVPPRSRLSLGEGTTPLVRSRRIGPAAGLSHLLFKVESANPTGSYKDRFAAVAVSRMLAAGKRQCVATSSGNAGSALAAYCAAAGMECQIAVVQTAPEDKLRQMMAYGAKLLRVRGFGLDAAITTRAFEAIRGLGSGPQSEFLISAYAFSPESMTGVQTISYELAEQAGTAGLMIEHVFCPAGGGGLTLAVARGFEVLASRGALSRPPAIQCVQPQGNDTIASPLVRGESHGRSVECTTAVSGLQVPNPIDADAVIVACRASGGTGHLVNDDEVRGAHKRLACEEGIFCEPAGAVALAGALRAAEGGKVDPAAPMVCLVTATGFKDTKSVERMLDGAQCPTIDVDELERQAGAAG